MDGGRINSSSIDTVSILVVDDDITCLAIVAAILKKFKYEVVTVKNPKDALCTLRIKGGAFDLVVSDVHMPDMSGFELQQAIAQEFNLPVVLMSADEQEGIAMKGLECGASFFIMKPVSPDDLMDLWQFAAMKRKNNPGFFKEKNDSREKYINSDEEAAVSASSVNEDATNKKESKRKSPKKEGSDEKNGNGENSSQKRPKIVWTNSLHNRFLEAIRSIGLDRAVPKKILEVMNIPGLTRENVASHLQKYRIFLRRVSDASYKIQYSHKGLSRNLKSSSELSRIITPPQTLVPNTFTNLTYQNPPLPNLEASSPTSLISQSAPGQSRLLSNRGNWQKPNIGFGTSTLISRQNDLSCVRLTQSNYGAHTSIQGHLANISLEDHSSAMKTTLNTHPNVNNYDATCQKRFGSLDVTSSLTSLKNLTYQTNYVGYNISNIKNFTESRQSEKHEGLYSCRGITNLPCEDLQINNIDPDLLTQHVGNSNCFVDTNNIGREQFCDVIADYRMQLPSNSGFENGGEIQESTIAPLFDLSEFDMLSAQQALDLGASLPNQITIHNQAQKNNGDGNSSFYGDMVHWEKSANVPYSFDQTPNQVESSQLMTYSQGYTTSSQLNGTVLLPTNEQFLKGLANSLEFGTYAQQSKNVISPTHERNDDDFLESLLAPFREDQSLEESKSLEESNM